jgi:HSP20 family protein
MAITRWNPWGDFAEMERELRELSASLFERSPLQPGTGKGRMFPAVDVIPRGDDLVIEAQIPGIDPDHDVSVTLDWGLLRIHGERKREEKEEREGYYRIESNFGVFDRAIPVPETVTEDDVHADYDRGVLEITVKGGSPELTETKQIPVSSVVGHNGHTGEP